MQIRGKASRHPRAEEKKVTSERGRLTESVIGHGVYSPVFNLSSADLSSALGAASLRSVSAGDCARNTGGGRPVCSG